MSERDIFNAAREIVEPAQRAAFLTEACAGDEALRDRVEVLLRAHDQPDSLLDVPAIPPPGSEQSVTRAYSEPGGGGTSRHGDDADDDTAAALALLAPSQRPDSLGRLGHYEVLEVLGRGGFGVVFRAFDDVLQRVVAVKLLAPSMAATSPARKRFLREARSAARVRHENVVQIHAVEEQPLPHLVMEYVPGETLQQRLDRTGPLDFPEAVPISRQIAEGLAAAHETGLIHRDIKPSNILIDSSPHQHVKITDFGLARAADDASLTRSGVVAGTPMYMAPEQAKGETLDPRADLFSLGSVLYTMLAGRPPFRAETTLAVLKRVAEDTPRPIREVIPEVPEWLCRIVEKLHAKAPAERFLTAREVADVLADCEAQLKAHGALKDYSRIPGGQPRRWLCRLARWAATAALLMVIGVSLVWWRGWVNDLFAVRQPVGSGTETVPHQAEDNGWVSLFNGTDLTGWKTFAELPGSWRVEDGTLKGTGGLSFLYHEREYTDFHLRAEARINSEGDSGIFVRAPAHLTPQGESFSLQGYEAEINGDPEMNGRIHGLDEDQNYCVFKFSKGGKTRPGEWLLLEVVAQGNRIETRINGATTAVFVDSSHLYSRGRVALQTFKSGTTVEFRKLEINELPPIIRAEADGWVSLFNGKDLTGWKTDPASKGRWHVKEGALTCMGPRGMLFTQRDDYHDFELRTEVKLSPGGDSGIFFRSPFAGDGNGAYEVMFDTEDREKRTITRWAGLPRAWTGTRNLPADTWCTVELRAMGPRLAVKIDGQVVCDVTDDQPVLQPSCIALQHLGEGTRVAFRKIEIREPPVATARAKEQQETAARQLGVPVAIKNSIGMKLRLIPPGEFTMGSSQEEIDWLLENVWELKQAPDWLQEQIRGEGPARRVQVREPYYLGAHEVTVGQFRAFVQATKYRTEAEKRGGGLSWSNEKGNWDRKPEYVWNNPAFAPRDDYPVVLVSLADAQAFCGWLSKEEGRRYVVPTEEQWEYACRAGTTTRWSFGDDISASKHHDWNMTSTKAGVRRPVGRLAPNPFGLYDLHGNVNEMALNAEKQMVARGGNYGESAWRGRSASRWVPEKHWDLSRSSRGFRVAVVGDLKKAVPPKR